MKKTYFLSLFVLVVFCISLLAIEDAQAQRKRKKKSDDPTEEVSEDTSKKSKKTKKTKVSADEKKSKADEEKKLREELKKYNKNLDSYRRFKEDKVKAESEVNRLTSDLAKCKDVEGNCGKEVEALRKEIEDLTAKLNSQKPTSEGFGIPKEGTYYVVQIGAFQQKDVPTNETNPDFRKENAEGYNKYIMGVFNEIDQADQLKKFLMQIDFRRNVAYRPFIVPYKDGNRISLEEALGPEEATKRKNQLGQ